MDIATRRGIPARSILRTADRRKSWNSNLGKPEALAARLQQLPRNFGNSAILL
jgi:hypothetical protein